MPTKRQRSQTTETRQRDQRVSGHKAPAQGAGAGKEVVEAGPPAAQIPVCLGVATRGVKTGSDFAELMSATIADLISGAVTPQVGNAVCNAGGKLLKVVEMQYKWGSPSQNGEVTKDLQLVRTKE